MGGGRAISASNLYLYSNIKFQDLLKFKKAYIYICLFSKLLKRSRYRNF